MNPLTSSYLLSPYFNQMRRSERWTIRGILGFGGDGFARNGPRHARELRGQEIQAVGFR